MNALFPISGQTVETSTAIFVPPSAAASLYPGKVMHQRLNPVAHRFSYRVFNLLIDLDRLGEAGKLSRFFGVNRRNLVSFHESDHHDGAAPSLRAHADRLLAGAGIEYPASRILLACYPRILGQVFNPLAVYYAYDAQNRLLALIYEVRNTFGERHTYVCRVEPDEVSLAGIRQTRAKRFYVSPFIEMDKRYHFRMLPPGEHISWRILETDAEGPHLSATYHGTRCKLTDGALAQCLLRIPMQTWKIVGGIHYEALRLWLKGARYIPRGKPPAAVSYADIPRHDEFTPLNDAGQQANTMKRRA